MPPAARAWVRHVGQALALSLQLRLQRLQPRLQPLQPLLDLLAPLNQRRTLLRIQLALQETAWAALQSAAMECRCACMQPHVVAIPPRIPPSARCIQQATLQGQSPGGSGGWHRRQAAAALTFIAPLFSLRAARSLSVSCCAPTYSS